MVSHDTSRKVKSTIAGSIAAVAAFSLGFRLFDNRETISQSALAAVESYRSGSFEFAMIYAFITCGMMALGGVTIVLAWMSQSAADYGYNPSAALGSTYRGQRNIGLVLITISLLFMLLTDGSSRLSADRLRSGSTEGVILAQINNLPTRQNKKLLWDLQTDNQSQVQDDTAITIRVKNLYHSLTWDDQGRVLAFLNRAISRNWDIRKKRTAGSAITAKGGKMRLTAGVI